MDTGINSDGTKISITNTNYSFIAVYNNESFFRQFMPEKLESLCRKYLFGNSFSNGQRGGPLRFLTNMPQKRTGF